MLEGARFMGQWKKEDGTVVYDFWYAQSVVFFTSGRGAPPTMYIFDLHRQMMYLLDRFGMIPFHKIKRVYRCESNHDLFHVEMGKEIIEFSDDQGINYFPRDNQVVPIRRAAAKLGKVACWEAHHYLERWKERLKPFIAVKQ